MLSVRSLCGSALQTDDPRKLQAESLPENSRWQSAAPPPDRCDVKYPDPEGVVYSPSRPKVARIERGAVSFGERHQLVLEGHGFVFFLLSANVVRNRGDLGLAN